MVASLSVAAFAWQSYGDAAKQAIARWAPERVLLVKQEPPAEPRPPSFEVTTADAALPPPAALAQTPPQDVPPKVAPMSPELAQSFQTIAREIANLEHGIEQLKTDQDRGPGPTRTERASRLECRPHQAQKANMWGR